MCLTPVFDCFLLLVLTCPNQSCLPSGCWCSVTWPHLLTRGQWLTALDVGSQKMNYYVKQLKTYVTRALSNMRWWGNKEGKCVPLLIFSVISAKDTLIKT